MRELGKLSETELLRLVDEVDREVIDSNYTPAQRQFHTVSEVCKRTGVVFIMGATPNSDVDRIRAALKRFYRPKDVQIGGEFVGLTVHLDLFFKVSVPIAYGTVKLELASLTDATEMQLQRLRGNAKDEVEFFKAVCDVLDIGACLAPWSGFKKPDGEAGKYFDMAAFHNQAAAATALGAYDLRGSIQSALICSELAIKSALLVSGESEDFLRNEIGHDLTKSIVHLDKVGNYDIKLIGEALQKLPHFVRSRYEEKAWTRIQVRDVLISAQSVLAEVARGFSKKSIWKEINGS
ncbi:ribosome-binding factor A [Litoreibacter arenae]|uniref:hypothetical protein n=1 Tax=Litoreibacter arenae TaxID=491388 RepID=UPI0012B541EC|nr:hypothetical protein [Litoreibacter arenae]